jgi:hypothetical protein
VIAIVAVETVLLVLLLVLVVGLLRSHAEILRRLGPPEQGVPTLPPKRPESRAAAAPSISGAMPGGDAIALDIATQGPTLLAFLTTGCTTCAGFWETLGERRLPPEVGIVIVTHDRGRESPSRIRKLAPPRVPVVMSSAAWTDYEVPGSPYFVLVNGVVLGEGVATTFTALASLVTDAIEDQRASGAAARGQHVDDVLAAAGIGPDHPSLYPGPPHPTARRQT